MRAPGTHCAFIMLSKSAPVAGGQETLSCSAAWPEMSTISQRLQLHAADDIEHGGGQPCVVAGFEVDLRDGWGAAQGAAMRGGKVTKTS